MAQQFTLSPQAMQLLQFNPDKYKQSLLQQEAQDIPPPQQYPLLEEVVPEQPLQPTLTQEPWYQLPLQTEGVDTLLYLPLAFRGEEELGPQLQPT